MYYINSTSNNNIQNVIHRAFSRPWSSSHKEGWKNLHIYHNSHLHVLTTIRIVYLSTTAKTTTVLNNSDNYDIIVLLDKWIGRRQY